MPEIRILGTEKTIIDNTEFIPIQEVGGTTRHASVTNLKADHTASIAALVLEDASLNSRVDLFDARIENFEDDIIALDGRTDALETTVSGHTGDIADLVIADGDLQDQIDAITTSTRVRQTLDVNTTFDAFPNDNDIYFTCTADRTANINNGATSKGDTITFSNISASTYKLTITYNTSATLVLYKYQTAVFKWNGTIFDVFYQKKNTYILETTANYAILNNDNYGVINCDTSSNPITITLPPAAYNINRIIRINLTGNDASLDKVIIVKNSSDGGIISSDALSEIWLTKKGNYVELQFNLTSSAWEILTENITCELEIDTYAGFGSTDTKIMRFTNIPVNVGNLITENHTTGYSSNAKGLEITIQKSGVYSLVYNSMASAGSNEQIGISVDSNQLTTGILSITMSHRKAWTTIFANGGTPVPYTAYFKKGQVIRSHTGNSVVPTTAAGCKFILSYVKG